MKAYELIRGVLDLIEKIESQDQQETAEQFYDDETRRMNQIADLKSSEEVSYANSPTTAYASIDAVTKDAGGGTNTPKHPADIRSDSVAMYPGKVFGGN